MLRVAYRNFNKNLRDGGDGSISEMLLRACGPDFGSPASTSKDRRTCVCLRRQ